MRQRKSVFSSPSKRKVHPPKNPRSKQLSFSLTNCSFCKWSKICDLGFNFLTA